MINILTAEVNNVAILKLLDDETINIILYLFSYLKKYFVKATEVVVFPV